MVAVAAPREAEAVLRGLKEASRPEFFELIETGVGKAAAAAGVAVRLTRPVSAVVSIGIGGALPHASLPLLASVFAEWSVFGDEGVDAGDRFISLEKMSFGLFGPGGRALPDAGLASLLRSSCEHAAGVATVSSCSGTDAAAARIAARTGAGVECMEGAAVGLAAMRAGVPFAELRVISNTTGDRDRQVWDLEGSLERLSALATRVASVLVASAPG